MEEDPTSVEFVTGVRDTSSDSEAAASTSDSEDVPICWICLESGSADRPLSRLCRCPRQCHATCIARWQLQSAGTRKETHCEFCSQTLPEWKYVLTPCSGSNAPAVMNVNFDGRTYSFEVSSGPQGYRNFTAAIRKAFGLPEDSELNITFTCDEPSTGSLLTLHGSGAYDAAVHCAAVSAARRLTQPSHHPSPLPTHTTQPGAAHSARREGQTSPSVAETRRIERAAAAPPTAPVQQHALRAAEPTAPGASFAGPTTGSGKDRRLTGLGRKLRSAICDLLSLRP